MLTYRRDFASTAARDRWMRRQRGPIGLLASARPSAAPGGWLLRGKRWALIQCESVTLCLAASDPVPAGFAPAA